MKYYCLLLLSFLFSSFAFAQVMEPIILGISNAQSGPAEKLGNRLNLGAELYFKHLNANGGIHKRPVQLVSLDDGYEPFRAVQNTYQLLNRPDVFALFNYVGTPTSHAVLPIVKQYDSLYLMPFTGAEFLRFPIKDYVVNLRASYYQEADAQIAYLFDNLDVKRLGLLIQADEFGKAVEQGYLNALSVRGLEPVVTTRFRRNTEDISLALHVLQQNHVDAVAFVGTYKPLAELINLGYKQGFQPVYSTVSFVSSHDLFQGIEHPSHVLVTQVLPEPVTCELEICKAFVKQAHASGIKDVDPVVFEGYMNAYVFSEVAKRCKQLTKACFKGQYQKFKASLKGLSVKYDVQTHQAMNDIYFSIFDTRE